MVATLADMLAKIVTRNGLDWDRHVAKLAWAYNHSPQLSTGLSPYLLMFGREPNPAGSNSISKIPPKYFQVDDDFLADSILQKFFLQKARQALDEVKKRQTEYHNKLHKTKPGQFQVGDRVMLFNPAIATNKLSAKYTGPFSIVSIRDNTACITLCSQPHGEPQRVHFERLSLCYPELGKDEFTGRKGEKVPSVRAPITSKSGEVHTTPSAISQNQNLENYPVNPETSRSSQNFSQNLNSQSQTTVVSDTDVSLVDQTSETEVKVLPDSVVHVLLTPGLQSKYGDRVLDGINSPQDNSNEPRDMVALSPVPGYFRNMDNSVKYSENLDMGIGQKDVADSPIFGASMDSSWI